MWRQGSRQACGGLVRRCCGVCCADRRGGKYGVNTAAARQGALHQDFFRLPPLPCLLVAPHQKAMLQPCCACYARCGAAGLEMTSLHRRQPSTQSEGGGQQRQEEAIGENSRCLVWYASLGFAAVVTHHITPGPSISCKLLPANCCPFLHAARRHHHHGGHPNVMNSTPTSHPHPQPPVLVFSPRHHHHRGCAGGAAAARNRG